MNENDDMKNEDKQEDENEKQKITEVKLNREYIKHKVLTCDAKMYLKPHKGVAARDYLTMVRETNEFKDRPEWDRSQNTLTLSIVESRKNLNNARLLLEEKQQEFTNYCSERDKQITDINEKEQKLRESFEFFDEFVKENIEKRERAEEKILKEKETREIVDNEIQKVNKRIERLNELKGNMIKDIIDNGKFEAFLIWVGKSFPDDFSSEPEKIIERYQLLVDVQNELSVLQRQQIESLQDISNEVDEETDGRSEQLIDLNNLLTDLYNRRQVAAQEVWKWKCALNRVTTVAAQMALETEEAQSACDDLYLQVCGDIGRPTESLEKAESNEKLRIILDRILELRKILKVANQRFSCNYSNRPNSQLSRPKKENPKPRTRP